MAKSNGKQIDQFKDELANTALQKTQQVHNEIEKAKTYKMLGAITAMDAIAMSLSSTLSSQALRGLEKIEQEKLYLSLGYETFVEFLNSDDSPVTKNQYYDRIKLLNSEGDQLYDTLSQLSFPVSKRKLLGKGEIAVEGETVIVKTADGEEQIELNDKNRLLQTISALADRAAETTALKTKLDKGAKDNQRLKERIRDLEENPTSSNSVARSPLDVASITVAGALAELAGILSSAAPEERQYFLTTKFGLITAEYNRVQDVLAGDEDDSFAVSANGNGHYPRLADSVFDDDED